jgi:hypothetical protein
MAKRTVVVCITLALICCVVGAAWAAMNKLTPAEQAVGWKLLFDGKTLTGWKATGDPEGWAVENGVIANLAKNGGLLATDGRFGNFTFYCEFKNEENANSGIFFRWADLSDPVQRGIEMQIFDSYGNKNPGRHDCGAIYDVLAPRVQACKPAGEWNKVSLTCKDNLVWIDLNGKRVIYMNLNLWTTPHMNPDGTGNKFSTAYKDMPRAGHIGFQDHGHKVWFRNVKIRPL